MSRPGPLLLTLMLLSGCGALNDSLVRFRFQDLGLSDRVSSQIREGLGKRSSAPAVRLPDKLAPAFLDQG